ncbi:hypothetical protein P280DRAFT_246092 [Massarina eburnea CBS 473.64]|uniref:Uncharacterized protein n=1 Tax=Massarina eburnea CBS 473.64 TaxID=1395130 RepID=A0A6A6S7L7_9PLEO|nr:hypothetical protein P280DRAFT_246092 [Massarina eburnea CBS 473.64]
MLDKCPILCIFRFEYILFANLICVVMCVVGSLGSESGSMPISTHLTIPAHYSLLCPSHSSSWAVTMQLYSLMFSTIFLLHFLCPCGAGTCPGDVTISTSTAKLKVGFIP